MGLVRYKYEIGVISKVCPVCFRCSPVTKMTKVVVNGVEKLVCATIGGFMGSCEAKYYEPDKREIINEFKNFSW